MKDIKLIFPLADRVRPDTIEGFIGQKHIIGKGKIIGLSVENGVLNSMIFWGPPGIGKTTLSRILVKTMDYPAIEFSAAISKISDIREVMKKEKEAKKSGNKPLVLFVDEIHHFNRSMQDAFLPFVENGDIILLGTTTENPAYKISRALLSRIKIVELFPLTDEDLKEILSKGIEFINKELEIELKLSDKLSNIIINYSAGDSRRLLNLLEYISVNNSSGETIDEEIIRNAMSNGVIGYDRTGDDRYGLISAFHKSIRNSDLDASLFWLYRMLNGGEDPHFILRRMIRIAAEDIGFADPEALSYCLRGRDAYNFLGSPEGDIFLTQIAVYLALAPKSNSLYLTEKKMRKIVDKYKNTGIPLHILNPSNSLAKKKGAGNGYLYAHDFEEKTTIMDTMPVGVSERDFYLPNKLGFEKKIKERMDYWKNLKEKIRK